MFSCTVGFSPRPSLISQLEIDLLLILSISFTNQLAKSVSEWVGIYIPPYSAYSMLCEIYYISNPTSAEH